MTLGYSSFDMETLDNLNSQISNQIKSNDLFCPFVQQFTIMLCSFKMIDKNIIINYHTGEMVPDKEELIMQVSLQNTKICDTNFKT